MSQAIARLSTLAAARVVEAAEHLAIAGYGPRTKLSKDKSLIDHATTQYVDYHGEAMRTLDYDPGDPMAVLGYMRNTPRCGCPDILPGQVPDGVMRFERGRHGRWPHYKEGIRVHWSFSQIGRRQNHAFTGTVDQAIRDALRQWQMICGLRFLVVSTRAEANISLTDGRIDGPQSTLAWSMLPHKGISANHHLHNTQTGTTQLYDWEEQWTDAITGNISLPWVAFHEIGHALGWGHSKDRNDAMFAAYIPGRANLPGQTERRVAREDYPGEPWVPDAPHPGDPPTNPPTPPGQPRRGSIRLVNGIFSGDYEVIV